MAMDFPASPTNGQTYTSGGVSYTWNGYAWVAGMQAFADAPSDGNEYVRVNGVWRLKETILDLSGQPGLGLIPVPVGAKMCALQANVNNPAATINQLGLRFSVDGATFITGVGDYTTAGAQHHVGTNGYLNVVAANSTFLPISTAGDVTTIPHNVTAEINLTRTTPGDVFGVKSYASSYGTAAAQTWQHSWFSGFQYAGNGGVLAVKALGLFMAYGGNFGPNSRANIRWMY